MKLQKSGLLHAENEETICIQEIHVILEKVICSKENVGIKHTLYLYKGMLVGYSRILASFCNGFLVFCAGTFLWSPRMPMLFKRTNASRHCSTFSPWHVGRELCATEQLPSSDAVNFLGAIDCYCMTRCLWVLTFKKKYIKSTHHYIVWYYNILHNMEAQALANYWSSTRIQSDLGETTLSH